MSEVRLTAETRTEFGKGASRRDRRDNKVPAVLYGHGTQTRHLLLSAREFNRAIRGGANTVLTLALETGDELALPKSFVRHPLRDYIEHVDLILVRRGEKVVVDVQVRVVGDAEPGTLVLAEASVISIEVEALHIPESIEVSVEGQAAGSQILAGQIDLPAGATLVTDPEALIVAVALAPSANELEGDGSGEAAAAEAEAE